MKLSTIFSAREKNLSTILIILFSALAWTMILFSNLSGPGNWQYINYENICGFSNIDDIGAISFFSIFICAWAAMILAMMLPSIISLVTDFEGYQKTSTYIGFMKFLLIFGYLSVWIVFGIAAYAFKLALYPIANSYGYLESILILINTSLFFFAGLYQFSKRRNKCIKKCRYLQELITYNRGVGNIYLSTIKLGALHGIYCIGCYWVLMLLMFSVSILNIEFMIVLGIVMTVEKNVKWGKKITEPLGFALIVISIVFLISFYAHIL